MKLIFAILLLFTLFTATIVAGKTRQSPVVKQGISGFVYVESGNRMPMKNAVPDPGKGLSTTVYVYEATNISQVSRVGNTPFYTAINTRPVANVLSDSTGAFKIRLAPGIYSLFVKLGNRFYANAYDSRNNINPVTVENGKLTETKITINSSAVY